MKIVLLEGRANFLMKLLRCQFVPSEPDREPFSELINQLFLFKEPEKPVFGKVIPLVSLCQALYLLRRIMHIDIDWLRRKPIPLSQCFMAIFSFLGQTNFIFALVNNRKCSFQNSNLTTRKIIREVAEFCWFNLAPGESSQFHEFGTNFIRGENRGWILGAKLNICASYEWNHMNTDWGKFFVCK